MPLFSFNILHWKKITSQILIMLQKSLLLCNYIFFFPLGVDSLLNYLVLWQVNANGMEEILYKDSPIFSAVGGREVKSLFVCWQHSWVTNQWNNRSHKEKVVKGLERRVVWCKNVKCKKNASKRRETCTEECQQGKSERRLECL